MKSKPKLNQPVVETTTTLPNITIEKEKNLELAKRCGIDLTPQPSKFEQCIKEWENRGWNYYKSEHYNWFFVKKEHKEICFDCDKNNYECESFFEIDLELNALIVKTLKAMENNNE